MKLKIYTAEEKAHRKSLLLRCLFVAFVLPLANIFLLYVPSIILEFNAASRGWNFLVLVAALMDIISSVITAALPIAGFAIFGLSYFKYSNTTKVRGIFKPFFYLPGSLMLFFLICISPLVSAGFALTAEYLVVSAGQSNLSHTVFWTGLPMFILISIFNWLSTIVLLILFMYLCTMERMKHAPDELFTNRKKVHLPKLDADNLRKPMLHFIYVHLGLVLFQLITQTTIGVVLDIREGVLYEIPLVSSLIFYGMDYVTFGVGIGAILLTMKWSIKWLRKK